MTTATDVHESRTKEAGIVAESQKPLSFIKKAAKWPFILLVIIPLYWAGKDQVKEFRAEAEKAEAPEKAQGRTGGGAEVFFLVTADSPACVTIPAGDSILAAVGKGGNIKVFYPDGEMMRIGPNQRAPVRSFEAGSRICLLLDDGEKQPVKMRLRS